jgi:hypothetical protein
MRFRMICVSLSLFALLLFGSGAMAQSRKHSAAWYRTHRTHSAAWYRSHGTHSAAWNRTHRRHSAAWYRAHRK